MSAGLHAVDELAAQLDAALIIDDQKAESDGASTSSDAAVPDYASEDDSIDDTASTAGSVDSSCSSEYAADGPPPPLSIYEPKLPNGVKTLFAGDVSSVDSIAQMIKMGSAKNIIVMAGAGLSTNANIPDFRSPTTGLYANLKKFNLPYPEAIFTIDFFRKNPKPFFILAKELYPGQHAPTLSHFFIKLLAQKGLLLRHYTQNIDCLERVAGIDPDLIVEAHGSFYSAHCIGSRCRKEHPIDWVEEQIFSDKIPRCAKCRSLVKPDIVFFGENLPSRFFELMDEDFAKCDLLVIVGTSLLVQPFASLVDEVKEDVPRLLVNMTRVGELKVPGAGLDFDGKYSKSVHRDALLLGDCDEAYAARNVRVEDDLGGGLPAAALGQSTVLLSAWQPALKADAASESRVSKGRLLPGQQGPADRL
ncbi:NAD-dependent protein deacetylase sirtuin-2 [Dipsacomyces acuminosporus]|nr:NAD-dependent protein deacetylase sirtuin-2 [Dipsacomyces acuminosporus]